ncbi:MAG: hypothetical protein R3F59_34000 [Myxococcota bacterium]
MSVAVLAALAAWPRPVVATPALALPAAEPVGEPAAVAPARVPVAAAPVVAAVVAVPAPAPAPVPRPHVDKALVSAPDAERLVVTCGEARFEGTRSVRLADFAGGACAVEAWVAGEPRRVPLTLDRVGQWTCAARDGGLSCGP